MLTLLKLGGSLITDKRVEASFRADVCQRIAHETAAALKQHPDIPLIIGHGSGSFGHVAAKKHNTIAGVHTPEEWRGFAEVATVAAELNRLVTKTLHQAGIATWQIQPSASAIARNGVIQEMNLAPIHAAIEHGIVPIVYGDVALDIALGGTIISTETVFTYLVQQLPVTRVILVGEVDGVYDHDKQVIPQLTPVNFSQYASALGGSAGTDVTGGMLTKVSDMLALVTQKPELQVQIINGLVPDVIYQTLLGQGSHGTLIHAG